MPLVDRQSLRNLAFLALSATALAGYEATRPVQAAEITTYTSAQAGQGAQTYQQHCASCHGATLAGGGAGPALSGEAFSSRWNGRSIGSLIQLISTSMPPGGGAGMQSDDFLNVTAYILQANQITAGQQALAADSEMTLAALPHTQSVEPVSAGNQQDASPVGVTVAGTIADFVPLSAERIRPRKTGLCGAAILRHGVTVN